MPPRNQYSITLANGGLISLFIWTGNNPQTALTLTNLFISKPIRFVRLEIPTDTDPQSLDLPPGYEQFHPRVFVFAGGGRKS